MSSDGVYVDTTPPQVSRTYKVIEVTSADSNADIDYTTDATTLHIDWSNVFVDDESDLERFIVCIGTEKGQCDIAEAEITDVDTTHAQLSDLNLDTFVVYHASVTACNMAWLCSVSHSDGVKVCVDVSYFI